MIVPVNSEKYRNLFADAERFLKLSEGTINDLNAYYGYMKDFYNEATKDRKGYRFVMMPMDEDVFNINLNTRTISIPTAFSRIGGVQADQMAELVIFETDRYFDYMDLANTLIYVQWQLPNASQTTGATYIDMKDLESKPGKIRFAWPLHDVITKYDGVVKFSVRFYLMTEEKDADGNIQNKLAYSLNTLEASFAIKPALNPSGDVLPEQLGGLFEKSIINSLYTGDGRIPPNEPSFATPGLDMTIVDKENSFVRYATDKESPIKMQIAKLHDNKLVLKAQANTQDAGNITYDWRFCEDGHMLDDGTLLWESLNTQGEFVYEKAEYPRNPATGKEFLSNIDRYYENKGDEENPDWQPFTGSEIPEDTQLFEKYTQYSLPATGDVVGYYAVVATNVIGDLETNGLESKPVWSSRCYLPGPAEIKFLSEDDPTKIFSQVVEDGIPTIKINTVEDINSPNMKYTWYYSSLTAEDAINSANNNVPVNSAEKLNTLDISKPGWYTANVAVNLNRKDKDVGTPVAHTIYAKAKIDEIKISDDLADRAISLSAGEQCDLIVDVAVNAPEGFSADSISDTLYKNLKYKWEYRTLDGKNDWAELKAEDISETNPTKMGVSLNESGNILRIRRPQNETAAVRSYRCIVINDLGANNSFTAVPDEADQRSPIFHILS